MTAGPRVGEANAARGGIATYRGGLDESRLRVEDGHLLGGRYRLGRTLGHGGMAEVFAAIDTRLDREVAVKVIAGHLEGQDDAARRFSREVLAAAAVNHPNVVSVFDADVDDHRPYLVTELVPGGTLAARIDGRPLPTDEVATIGAQVAAGLAAAHAIGLVHRDVKPANILLAADGAAKVADFGIARALDATATMTATVHGSAPYVAPEHVRGGDADEQTDVYALGCVLFEMLTGRPPFTSDTAIGVIGQHLHAEVPAIAELRPDDMGPLPSGLAALVGACLAKEPAQRPTMADAGRELAAFATPASPATPATPTIAAIAATRALEFATTAVMPAADADAGHAEEPALTTQQLPVSPARRTAGRSRTPVIVAGLLAAALVWFLWPRDQVPTAGPVADAGPTATPEPTGDAPTEPSPEPTPPSAQAAINDFVDHLDAGRAAGQIEKKAGDDLTRRVAEIQREMDKDDRTKAIEKAAELRSKIEDRQAKDEIDPALADVLTADADSILRALADGG